MNVQINEWKVYLLHIFEYKKYHGVIYSWIKIQIWCNLDEKINGKVLKFWRIIGMHMHTYVTYIFQKIVGELRVAGPVKWWNPTIS